MVDGADILGLVQHVMEMRSSVQVALGRIPKSESGRRLERAPDQIMKGPGEITQIGRSSHRAHCCESFPQRRWLSNPRDLLRTYFR